MTYHVSHYFADMDCDINLSFKDFDNLSTYIEFFFIGVGERREYSLSISMVEDE